MKDAECTETNEKSKKLPKLVHWFNYKPVVSRRKCKRSSFPICRYFARYIRGTCPKTAEGQNKSPDWKCRKSQSCNGRNVRTNLVCGARFCETW